MMLQAEGNLQRLAGGLRVKARVQHPQVKPRKDRAGWPWVFRYYDDAIQPDGSVKVLRRYHEIAPSKGEGAITKKQAEVERDKVLGKLNAPTVEQAVQQVAATGVALLSEGAAMYEQGYLGRADQIARPTREKETFYLNQYIVLRWGDLRLSQIQPQAVEDWLHTAAGGGGLASHCLRFLVDQARRARDHEPHLPLRRGTRALGGGQTQPYQQGETRSKAPQE